MARDKWGYHQTVMVLPEHPRGKSKVHPTKLTVRNVMGQLADLDMDLGQSFTAQRNLFAVAKHVPERIDDILSKVEAASKPERKLWEHAITHYENPLVGGYHEDLPDQYTVISALIPLIAPRVRLGDTRRGDYAGASLSNTRYIMRDVYESLPRKTDERDPVKLFKAAEMVLHIEAESRRGYRTTFNQPYQRPPRITKKNIDDVVYIASNLSAVEPLLPELLRRKTHERDIVSALVDAGTSALLIGVL